MDSEPPRAAVASQEESAATKHNGHEPPELTDPPGPTETHLPSPSLSAPPSTDDGLLSQNPPPSDPQQQEEEQQQQSQDQQPEYTNMSPQELQDHLLAQLLGRGIDMEQAQVALACITPEDPKPLESAMAFLRVQFFGLFPMVYHLFNSLQQSQKVAFDRHADASDHPLPDSTPAEVLAAQEAAWAEEERDRATEHERIDAQLGRTGASPTASAGATETRRKSILKNSLPNVGGTTSAPSSAGATATSTSSSTFGARTSQWLQRTLQVELPNTAAALTSSIKSFLNSDGTAGQQPTSPSSNNSGPVSETARAASAWMAAAMAEPDDTVPTIHSDLYADADGKAAAAARSAENSSSASPEVQMDGISGPRQSQDGTKQIQKGEPKVDATRSSQQSLNSTASSKRVRFIVRRGSQAFNSTLGLAKAPSGSHADLNRVEGAEPATSGDGNLPEDDDDVIVVEPEAPGTRPMYTVREVIQAYAAACAYRGVRPLKVVMDVLQPHVGPLTRAPVPSARARFMGVQPHPATFEYASGDTAPTSLAVVNTRLRRADLVPLGSILELEFGLLEFRLANVGLTNDVARYLLSNMYKVDSCTTLSFEDNPDLSLPLPATPGNTTQRLPPFPYTIAPYVKHSKSLRTLDLSGIPLGLGHTRDMSPLAEALAHGPDGNGATIQVLKLNRCRLTTEALQVICLGIAKSNLASLSLRGNGIDGMGAAAIASIFLPAAAVLPAVSPGDHCYDPFWRDVVMRKRARGVISVDLSENRIGRGAAVLGAALGRCSHIKHFMLTSNEIQGGFLGELCEHLRDNKSIELLDLSENPLGTDGKEVPAIAVLGEWLGLQDREHNSDGAEHAGSAQLSEGASTSNPACQLKALGLANCGITDQGVIALCGGLLVNQSLERLNLGGNPVTTIAWTALAQGLADHPKIQHVELGSNDDAGSAFPWRMPWSQPAKETEVTIAQRRELAQALEQICDRNAQRAQAEARLETMWDTLECARTCTAAIATAVGVPATPRVGKGKGRDRGTTTFTMSDATVTLDMQNEGASGSGSSSSPLSPATEQDAVGVVGSNSDVSKSTEESVLAPEVAQRVRGLRAKCIEYRHCLHEFIISTDNCDERFMGALNPTVYWIGSDTCLQTKF